MLCVIVAAACFGPRSDEVHDRDLCVMKGKPEKGA